MVFDDDMQMKVWYGLTPCSLYGIYLYNQCNKQLFEEQLWKARTVKKISRSISTVTIQPQKFMVKKLCFCKMEGSNSSNLSEYHKQGPVQEAVSALL